MLELGLQEGQLHLQAVLERVRGIRDDDPWALLQRKPVLAVDFERAKRRIELQRRRQGHARTATR